MAAAQAMLRAALVVLLCWPTVPTGATYILEAGRCYQWFTASTIETCASVDESGYLPPGDNGCTGTRYTHTVDSAQACFDACSYALSADMDSGGNFCTCKRRVESNARGSERQTRTCDSRAGIGNTKIWQSNSCKRPAGASIAVEDLVDGDGFWGTCYIRTVDASVLDRNCDGDDDGGDDDSDDNSLGLILGVVAAVVVVVGIVVFAYFWKKQQSAKPASSSGPPPQSAPPPPLAPIKATASEEMTPPSTELAEEAPSAEGRAAEGAYAPEAEVEPEC